MKKSLAVSLALLGCLGFNHVADAEMLINFEDFSSSSDYQLFGGAQRVDNSIQLSAQGTKNTAGAIWFNTPVDVSNFNVAFSYTFSGGQFTGADGMVFVIQDPDSPKYFGGTGGAIGYGGTIIKDVEQPGITNSIGVEYDSWRNDERGDNGSSNHVGINVNGSSESLAQSSVSPTFNGTGTWYSWIDYDGTTLSVFVSQSNAKPASPTLTYGSSASPFVISDYTGSSTGLVGLTASTGGVTQTTTLNSFGFDSEGTVEVVPEPSTLALLGSGAIFASIVSRRKSRKTGLAV